MLPARTASISAIKIKVGTPAIPQRLAWTIERLDIQPTDHLLEIGCGRGVAVSLVCDRLTTGRITAIDRSHAAITAATARNRDHIAAGKVTLEAVPLADAAFTGHRFDKVFAVNVNAFWTTGMRELAVVKRVLHSQGTLYLVYQPPTAGQLAMLSGKVTATLERAGLGVASITTERRGTPLLCVSARAHSAA